MREQIFPGDPLDWDDPNGYKAAAEIVAEWDSLPMLTGRDVAAAVKRVGITHAELARGTGMNVQWLSAVLLGKRPMSVDTEFRLRHYFQQLSQQQQPRPIAGGELRTRYSAPADVPLTEDVLQALTADPISDDTLGLLADCLASNGIPQTVLAQWWGLRYKFYQDMRYGRKPVPRERANQLRRLFGVREIELCPMPDEYRALTPFSIPATPEILSLFDDPNFSSSQLRQVLEYLRTTWRFKNKEIAAYLRITEYHLCNMRGGSKNVTIAPALRTLFVVPRLCWWKAVQNERHPHIRPERLA